MTDKNTISKDNSNSLLKKTIKKNSKYLAGIVLVSVVTALLRSANPVFYQKIIDDAIPNKNVKLLFVCIALIAVFPLINVGVSTVRQRLGYRFSNNSENEMRTIYFEKILNMNYPAFIKLGPVKLMNIITRSIGKICGKYLDYDVIQGTNSIVNILVVFCILLHYSVIIAITTFLVVPIIFFIIKLWQDKIGDLINKELEHLNACDKFLLQVFNGIRTVRSYAGQEKEIKNFKNWLAQNAVNKWKIEKQNLTARAFVPTAASEIVLGGIFTALAFSVMKGTMTIGTLVAVISYVPNLIQSITLLMSLQVGKAEISKIMEDLDAVFSEEPEFEEEAPREIDNSVIAFKDIDFTYGRENFDLKIENLEINKGDFITIVGSTGGGKSSIMDIINKFYPISGGEVLFGDRSINDIGTKALREQISTMFQDVYMFNGTIAENISYPEKPDMAKINEVMKKAQLSGFVDKLPNKSEEIVEENGANFSGGECQRIALARMLYKDSDVFLLDEPTAALDAGTSKAIFDMLDNENKSRGKTVICITHDAGKAVYGNKVMVVNGGRIVEFGNPEELIKQDGAFSSLYNAQQKLTTA